MKSVTLLAMLLALPLLAIAFFLSGCSKSQSQSVSTSGTQPGAAPAASTDQVLNIYTWSEYLPQEVRDEFTKRTGIKVTVDTYDSNETLESKLASGVVDYDLVFPSDYKIQPLIRQKLIAPLDKSRFKNLGNLDPHFLNQRFDPGNHYSIPYLWGTTGLGYAKKYFPNGVDSWNAVFDPKYAGKILMLNDMRECFAVALKKMGKSLNETDPAILQQAADLLKQQHALVRAYDSENYDNELKNGDVILSHGWNGQLAKVVSDDPADFAYVLPKEGGTIWLDNMCIPTTARHPDAAYQFIDFVLEPQINAKIVNGVNYASADTAAKPFIDPKIVNDVNIYPTPNMLKGWEFLDDLGGKTNRELADLWTSIKSQ